MPSSAPGSGHRRAHGHPPGQPRRAVRPLRRSFSARGSGTPQASSRCLHRLVSTLGLQYAFWSEARFLAQSQSTYPGMKPPPFSYHDPRTAADVVGLLGSLDNAKLLAGGQSLMPMLNMRFVLPDHVIDLNRVEGLNYIREADGALEIGGMTRQRDLEFSDVVARRCPLIAAAIRLGR